MNDMPADDPLANVLDLASRRPVQSANEVRAEAGGKPLLRIEKGELDRIATEAEALIIQAGVPLYQRGRDLVRPILMEVKASHDRTALVGGLIIVKSAGLIDMFCAVAEWVKRDGRTKHGWARCDPPKAVAEILLERHGHWQVPVIAGVVTKPTVRTDNTVLQMAGYDPTTRLFHFGD